MEHKVENDGRHHDGEEICKEVRVLIVTELSSIIDLRRSFLVAGRFHLKICELMLF